MISFAETADTGLLKNDQDYFTWLNGFTDNLKDYTMFQSEKSEEAINMALQSKPYGGGIYFMSWFEHFKAYLKDYSMFSSQQKYLKTCTYSIKAMPVKNKSGFYNEWFKTFTEYLKNYVMFVNDKNKMCLDMLVKTVPDGSDDGDYRLWLNKYNYYLKQYQMFNNEKYKVAYNLLMAVKPVEVVENNDQVTLEFLKNIDKTAKDIVKNRGNSKAFIKLIKAYKELLLNEAINGKEWAKQDYNTLKDMF